MTPTDLYNLWCLVLHAPNKLKSRLGSTGSNSMTVSSFSPTTFCHLELDRALKEQAFGIKGFSMVSSSNDQATALVALLDGPKISVQLTPRGFAVCVLHSINFFIRLIHLYCSLDRRNIRDPRVDRGLVDVNEPSIH